MQTSGLTRTTFARSLQLLSDKRVLVSERPLSTKASSQTRYRVADPYLRFWLRFVLPARAEIDRDRGDRALQRWNRGWLAWRGRAVEPVVRESLRRLLQSPATPWIGEDDDLVIGGYWTRSNDVEVDLVVADRTPVAKRLAAIGSIKWHESQPFSHRELLALAAIRPRVPGAGEDTPIIAVSRLPAKVEVADAVFDSEALMQAWQTVP